LLAGIRLSDAGFRCAPGRIRTCDRRIRSPLLCPLSYGRIKLIYAGNLPPGSSLKTLVSAVRQQ
jgi:hypothetical protein